MHLAFMIQRKVEAGVNLEVLKKEIISYETVAEAHSHPLLGMNLIETFITQNLFQPTASLNAFSNLHAVVQTNSFFSDG